ncbi:cytochrome P450 [Paracoccus sp. (in: a-proteobacteria)]|uniref:cytochrome P450 n=1 Tax=Paracoccus sp. TaxID=267 RepID=UPI0026E0BDB4|nr:cytochrome P450 [Paracoccus sp. (in: a-proteobacteria)]MDO5646791.1 cytochrome P450 [Paracoccus sp. (in: a-proteobacteria)]
MTPPRPIGTTGRSTLRGLIAGFRNDLLSALPERLYRGWMAEFRAPFVHSFFCNDPELVRRILNDPDQFPKSMLMREGLAPLLGNGVFISNGADWAQQRRIIDPAFQGGRIRDTLPAIWAAADATVARLSDGETDIEPVAAHAAADVIFRALFSIPISDDIAGQVFAAFQAHQRAQPLVNIAALVPWPRWLPRPHSRRTRDTAARIRALIDRLVTDRQAAIDAGDAPDDLATRIMTTSDSETGRCFTRAEMVDQVAVMFLAGHETSASVLAWALWLLAAHPDWQAKIAAEAATLTPDMAALSRMPATRAVFRETLRLYPGVAMFTRAAGRRQTFRDRRVPRGAQLTISPWHLHRHQRLWDRPDDFDPARWDNPAGQDSARHAFIPFSAGPRACPGAGLAMAEGVIMLARIVGAFHLSPGSRAPMPVLRLTLRSRDGILITLRKRATE